MKKFTLCFFALVFVLSVVAQTKLTGVITGDATSGPVFNASVRVKDAASGTKTNEKGEFVLYVPALPVTLVVSAIGFASQEMLLTSEAPLSISLAGTTAYLEPVVVGAALGTPRRLTQSPVSVEAFGIRELRANPSSDYYSFACFCQRGRCHHIEPDL
jgi:hypothetical protein